MRSLAHWLELVATMSISPVWVRLPVRVVPGDTPMSPMETSVVVPSKVMADPASRAN